ncbi:MAG: methyltransferase domain-containing protein [Thermoplasmata archaeon]
MIKLAKIRNRNISNAKFIVGNLENTCFPRDYFDVAVIIDALHHVPHPYNCLKEMKRISRDIILAEPNALNPIRKINELKFRNEYVKESSFTRWELEKYLQKLGYEKITFCNYNFIPGFIPFKFIKWFENFEEKLEKAPILKEFSGTILVIAKR